MSVYPLFALFIPLVALALSVVGIVLLTLAIRGRPVFSSPRCGRCGYDLRNVQFMAPETAGNCPECGVRLADRGAVSFGTWQRQPGRILIGLAVLVLPWLGLIGVGMFMRSQAIARGGGGGPQAKAAMSTPALLASLRTTLDSPWDWQELERRRTAGSLSQADVDAAFGVLINDLNAKRAAGKPRQPLHWADRFITPAIAGGNASPKQVVALAQAFYGTDPKFTMRSRARQDEPIALTLNEHESWDFPGMQRVWFLKSIVADGNQALSPELRYGGRKPPLPPDQFSGTGRDGQMELLLPHALPPGEHEIALTFDVGVVPERSTMRGLDGKPGTPEKWPSPVAQWQTVVKKTVTVLPRDQSPVALVTDSNLNPLIASPLTIEEALTRSATNGVQLVLKFKYDGSRSPVVSYRVWVQAGDQKIDYGTLVTGKTGRGGYQSAPSYTVVKALSPAVRTIDVLFEPDARAAEPNTSIEEVWGHPHQIRNVPLQRFDAPEAPAAGAR